MENSDGGNGREPAFHRQAGRVRDQARKTVKGVLKVKNLPTKGPIRFVPLRVGIPINHCQEGLTKKVS